MSDQYRLVFAGEVLDGQHPAVVKKRLAAALKLNDERLEMLFSGKTVVLKKNADKDNAARFQALFKKAGARLRVMPLEEASTGAETAPHGLNVLPVGADVLSEDERPQVPDADIDTSHISVQGAVFAVDEPEPEVQGPDVDHITMAEPGTRLGPDEEAEVIVELDADFDLAEVGARMDQAENEQTRAPVDMEALDFDVAEPGADMDTREKKPPPPPPDTSHLQIDQD